MTLTGTGLVQPEAPTGTHGVDRRDFLRVCTMALAAVGIPYAAAAKVAEAVVNKKLKPSVIWLHFQECTGCTESLLRTSPPGARRAHPRPDLARLPRDADGRRRATRRRRRSRRRWRRTPASTSSSSKAPSRPRTTASTARSAATPRSRSCNEVAAKAGGHHRHRLLRVAGAASRRPIPTRPARSASPSPQGQDGRQHPGLPGQPVQPPRHGAAVRDLRHAAGARRAGPAEVRLRPHHPRALPAPAALRRRPLRAEVRRRGPPARATASTSSAARARSTHANCSLAALRRGRSTPGRSASATPASAAPSRSSASASPLFDTVDIERPTPPDTYAPIHAEQGMVSPVATGVAGLVGGALVGAGFMALEEARSGASPRTAKTPGKEVSHGASTDAPAKGLAPRPARWRPRSRTVEAAERRPAAPADAVGMLYDATRCIGCKACVVACQEANDLHADDRRTGGYLATRRRPQRPHQERHQALSERRRRPALVHQGAVHALRRSGLRLGLHAGRAAQEGARASSATTRTSASAAATARWPARSTFRSSSGTRPPRRSSSASCAGTAWPKGGIPGLLRGLPARGGDLRQARGAAGRGASAASRSTRTATVTEGLRRDGRRRHAGALPLRTCPSRSSGCPSCRDEPMPDASRETFQHGALSGLRRADRAVRRAGRGASCATAGSRKPRRPSEQRRDGHERSASTHARWAARSFDPPCPGSFWRCRRLGVRSSLWRFAVGLGAVTTLNDGYPWGLWIAFDVVTGTALGLRRLRHGAAGLHPQPGQLPPARAAGGAHQRPRLLAGRLLGVVIDLGRHWNCLEDADARLALEPALGAARGRRSASWPTCSCSGSSCRRPCWSGRARASSWPRCALRATWRLPHRGASLHLDHRSRHPAAHDAPVLARLASC